MEISISYRGPDHFARGGRITRPSWGSRNRYCRYCGGGSRRCYRPLLLPAVLAPLPLRLPALLGLLHGLQQRGCRHRVPPRHDRYYQAHVLEVDLYAAPEVLLHGLHKGAGREQQLAQEAGRGTGLRGSKHTAS